MIAFLSLAAVLTALVVAGLLWPLLRRRQAASDASRAVTLASNAAIYREQLAELDAELKAGSIDQAQWDKTRAEIEQRALDEAPAETTASGTRSPRTAVALALAIPVVAALLYLALGTPQAIDVQALVSQDSTHAVSPQAMNDLLDKLTERMKQSPDEVEGWLLLGRSRARQQQFAQAAAAFKEAVRLQPNDSNLLADYADMLAMTQGRKLSGEPEQLIAKALKLDPDNVKALSISGTMSFERKDYNGAIRFWQKALALVPADSGFANGLRESIAQAQANGGKGAAGSAKASAGQQAAAKGPTNAAIGGRSLSGRVTLAAGTKVDPDATVFVYARPASGQRMPLAILKRKASELPLEFTLDDSMAMTQNTKLSDFDKVVVVARVSRNGEATARPDDLEVVSDTVAPGAKGIQLQLKATAR